MATVLAKPKWIGKSLSVWGAIIAMAATAFQVIGPIADAVGVTVPVTPQDVQEASHTGELVITAVGAVVGLVLTVVGRIRAGNNVQPVSMLPAAESKIVSVVTPPASSSKQTG